MLRMLALCQATLLALVYISLLSGCAAVHADDEAVVSDTNERAVVQEVVGLRGISGLAFWLPSDGDSKNAEEVQNIACYLNVYMRCLGPPFGHPPRVQVIVVAGNNGEVMIPLECEHKFGGGRMSTMTYTHQCLWPHDQAPRPKSYTILVIANSSNVDPGPEAIPYDGTAIMVKRFDVRDGKLSTPVGLLLSE